MASPSSGGPAEAGSHCLPPQAHSGGGGWRERKGVIYSKAAQFWRNGRLLPRSAFPLNTQRKNPPPAGRLVPVRLRVPLPFEVPPLGKHRQRWYDRPPGLVPGRSPVPAVPLESVCTWPTQPGHGCPRQHPGRRSCQTAWFPGPLVCECPAPAPPPPTSRSCPYQGNQGDGEGQVPARPLCTP